MALIHRIEATSDWLQKPSIAKRLNISFGALLVAVYIWGTFFVPTTILQNVHLARVVVDAVTTLFPWLAQIEKEWGPSGQKALFMHCVFVLGGAVPYLLATLMEWKHRISDKKLFPALPGESIVWVMASIAGIVLAVSFYYMLGGSYSRLSNITTFLILYKYTLVIAAFSF